MDAWILQAMEPEMVCAPIYIAVLILICRRKKPLRLVEVPVFKLQVLHLREGW